MVDNYSVQKGKDIKKVISFTINQATFRIAVVGTDSIIIVLNSNVLVKVEVIRNLKAFEHMDSSV